jgi:cyclopropane fatty-acyl-phospholipid synthase-like methyltransferase
VSLAFRLMYLFGFTPWDRVLPAELREVIEGPAALPRGRALDLGSGQGGKAIYMASHGWKVTAVENIPRALAEARKRADAADVEVDFRLGDVTRLSDLGLDPGYNLLFDFGCFHGLKAADRDGYVQGVTSLAAPGARLLMMAFTKPLPPVTVGVTEAELVQRFGDDWTMSWSHPDASRGTSAMTRAASTWFCLSRR